MDKWTTGKRKKEEEGGEETLNMQKMEDAKGEKPKLQTYRSDPAALKTTINI